MAATAKPQSKKSATKKGSNGLASHGVTRAPLPPIAVGHWSMPVDPYWWVEDGELHGGLLGVEMTEGPDGSPVHALVVCASMPTVAVDNWGDRAPIEAGEVVRVRRPSLLKLAELAHDPERCATLIVRALDDRGRKRIVVDVSNETVPRSDFKPRAPQDRLHPRSAAQAPVVNPSPAAQPS